MASSKLYPDLRYLSPEKHAIFKEIVVDGALLSLGMPSFGDRINEADALAIQAYVLEESRLFREEEAVAAK